ncbi:unnamed protein product, partial [marine sediment metagenome]
MGDINLIEKCKREAAKLAVEENIQHNMKIKDFVDLMYLSNSSGFLCAERILNSCGTLFSSNTFSALSKTILSELLPAITDTNDSSFLPMLKLDII